MGDLQRINMNRKVFEFLVIVLIIVIVALFITIFVQPLLSYQTNFVLFWFITIIIIFIPFLNNLLDLFDRIKKIARKVDLDIYLEHLFFYEQARIVILNRGKESITINSIVISFDGHGTAPQNATFHHEETTNIPFMIEPGGEKTITLSDAISHEWIFEKQKINLEIYDALGNVHTKYKKRSKNAKFGGIYVER